MIYRYPYTYSSTFYFGSRELLVALFIHFIYSSFSFCGNNGMACLIFSYHSITIDTFEDATCATAICLLPVEVLVVGMRGLSLAASVVFPIALILFVESCSQSMTWS